VGEVQGHAAGCRFGDKTALELTVQIWIGKEMSDDTNVALSVMDLENGFRNDEIVIRLHAQLLRIVGASTAPTSMARAGGGAVHSINGDIRVDC
jgi:hypothetical protein